LIYANLQAIVVGIPLLKPDLSLVDHEIKPDGSDSISVGRVLAGLEFISAISLISILKISNPETATLAMLYFISATCSAIFFSLTNSLITEIYPTEFKEHFRLVLFSKRAAFLIGPLVMGPIIGLLGNKIGIILDFFSFFISGLLLYSISTPLQILIKNDIEGPPIIKNVAEFHMPKIRFILTSLIIALVGIAGGAVNSIELPYIFKKLNLGSSFFGISLALSGLGALAGIFLDKRIPNNVSISKIVHFSILGITLSFIPWYFNSLFWFALALFVFGISITIFSNRTLFYLIDCFNGSTGIKRLFKNKPSLFLFYHQIDSIAMIVGAIVSGMLADRYSTNESVHLIIICLTLSIFVNFVFSKMSLSKEPK